jgi:MFS family permease
LNGFKALISDYRARRFGAASFTSVVGDGCNSVAITFAVLAIASSPSALGFVLAARLVGLSVSILGGGVLADRAERRSVMVAADLVRFGVQGMTAAALLTHHETVALLAAVQLVHGLASGFFLPASGGYLPSVVKSEVLQEVNGLLVAIDTAGSIVGPILAGFLTGAWGPGAAITVDAATFLVSASFFVGLPKSHLDEAAEGAESVIRSFRSGMQEILSRPWLRTGLLYFLVTQLLLDGPLYSLGPVVADETYDGAASWGLIMGAFGIGAVLGSVAASRLKVERPMPWITLAAAVPSGLLLALGLAAPLIVVLLAAVAGGLATSFCDVTWWTLLQRVISGTLLSRVLSWDLFTYYLARPLSLAGAGPVAALLGAPAVLIGSALGLLGTSGITTTLPSVRQVKATAAGAESDQITIGGEKSHV